MLEAGKLKNEGMEHFSEGHYTSSATAFNSAFELLDKYMNLFDLDEDYVRNNILDRVRKNVDLTTADNIAQVEEVRNEDIKIYQEHFDTRYEGYYLIMIYDSLFYGGIAKKVTKLKGQATRSKWINQLIGWGIFIAIIAVIAVIRSCSG